MKVREVKDLERHKCPIYMVFGNNRNWGAFFNKNKKQPVAIYVKGITPKIFDEILEHEFLHHAIHKINPNMSHKKEHWGIDQILYAEGDWF